MFLCSAFLYHECGWHLIILVDLNCYKNGVFQPSSKHRLWLPWCLHYSYCSSKRRERQLLLPENLLCTRYHIRYFTAMNPVSSSFYIALAPRIDELQRRFECYLISDCSKVKLQFRPKSVWRSSLFKPSLTLGNTLIHFHTPTRNDGWFLLCSMELSFSLDITSICKWTLLTQPDQFFQINVFMSNCSPISTHLRLMAYRGHLCYFLFTGS